MFSYKAVIIPEICCKSNQQHPITTSGFNRRIYFDPPLGPTRERGLNHTKSREVACGGGCEQVERKKRQGKLFCDLEILGCYRPIDVSKEATASIFRVNQSNKCTVN
jgi:hypothetical protein